MYYQHFNVSFKDDGTEILWQKWKYYVFDKSNSFEGADPFDFLTVVNVPFQGALGAMTFMAGNNSSWWRTFAFGVMASSAHSKLFTTR